VIITLLAGVGVAARGSLLADIGKRDDPRVVDFSKDPISPCCERGVCIVVQLRWLEGLGWFSPPFVVISVFLVSARVPPVVVLMPGRRSRLGGRLWLYL